MAKKSKWYLFLDTNIYLQFKDFDQIDWPNVFGCKEVCLVVTPTTLRELDELKYDQKSQRRQSRAKMINRKLSDLILGADVLQYIAVPGRKNVFLLGLVNDPRIEDYEGLQPTVADDHIIASILDFMAYHQDTSSQDVIFVSDDTGALNKARSKGIKIQRLDDGYRLPDEPSKEQQEINTLKKQLVAIQHQSPKLALVVRLANASSIDICTELTILDPPSDEQKKQFLKQEQQATDWRASESSETELFGLTAMEHLQQMYSDIHYSDTEIENYFNRRERYLTKIAAYIDKAYYHWDGFYRKRKSTFLLINNGTIPARDVVIRLIVPYGIIVLEDKDTELDYPPQRPSLPKTNAQTIQHVSGLSRASDIKYMTQQHADTSDFLADIDFHNLNPTIKRWSGNSTAVEWERLKSMHHIPEELTPIRFLFPPIVGEHHYELEYQLFAENLAEPTTGTIKIKTISSSKACDFDQLIQGRQ